MEKRGRENYKKMKHTEKEPQDEAPNCRKTNIDFNKYQTVAS